MASIKLDSFLDQMEKELDHEDKQIKVRPIQETTTMQGYLDQLMVRAETISFSYDERKERAEVYSNIDGLKKTEYFDITPDEYVEVCKEYCDDVDDKFNHSNWKVNRYGDLIRVFTNTKPVVNLPIVTINVSRAIDDYSLKELPEKVRAIIPIIMANRFVIAGQTGSGKTYFLNRALKNTFSGKYDTGLVWGGEGPESTRNKLYVPKNVSQDRIILVEEFHEIFPPNKNTICLGACPVKPGEPNIFSYIVQQTNLMRADHIFVGEIKGEESFYFMNNLSSGAKGGFTAHGQSPEHMLSRLRSLMTLSGFCDLSQAGTIIAGALDFVIYIDKHQIKEIAHLSGVYNRQQERFQMDTIYKA